MKRPIYLKAIVTALGTLLANLAVIMVGEVDTFGAISQAQWVTIAATTFAATAAVYGIRNGVSADPTTSTPEVDPQDNPEFGYGAIELLVVVILVVLLIFLVLRLA